MGIIQNSLNQAMATAMAGVLGVKHIGQQNISNKIQATETAAKLGEDIANLKADIVPLRQVSNEASFKRSVNIDAEKAGIEYVDHDIANTNPDLQEGTTPSEEAKRYYQSLRVANAKIKAKQTAIKLKQDRFNELQNILGGKK